VTRDNYGADGGAIHADSGVGLRGGRGGGTRASEWKGRQCAG